MSDSWLSMSASSYVASGALRRDGRYRSAVSRAYFAAFSAVTARLEDQGVAFAWNREGPPHAAIDQLVRANLSGLRRWEKRDLQKLMNVLRDSRTQADYRPRAAVGRREATQALQDAGLVMAMLEVPRE